jgi:predicted O-methyltransferase YrrM
MVVRFTPESANRLTRKDRTYRAPRWALAGAAAVLGVGGAAFLVHPVAGVICAVATGVGLLLAFLGHDLSIIRAELAEHGALLATASLRDGIPDPLNVAALCPENMRFVVQQIHQRRPRRVLEFGSGVSTVVIARILREFGDHARLDSFEHHERWYPRTRDLLERTGVTDVAHLHYAPLAPREDLDVPWYDLSALPDGELYDLVLVDGPQGGRRREPLARLGGFLAVRERLAPGAVILLDDGLRRGEREVVRRWQQAEPRLRVSFHRSDTGMWMIELPGPEEVQRP